MSRHRRCVKEGNEHSGQPTQRSVSLGKASPPMRALSPWPSASRGKWGQQKHGHLQQRDARLQHVLSHRLCPGQPPPLDLCPAAPGSRLPCGVQSCKRGREAGSTPHCVTTTLTLTRSLRGTKRRIFPLVFTHFTFVSPAQGTGLQFQYREWGQ